METIKEFSVKFDKPVYMGGETLSGHVNLQLEEEMMIKSIRLRLWGLSQVRFEEEVDSDDSGYDCGIRTNLANEEYFDTTIVLYGKEDEEAESENPIHPSGPHTYDFEYVLPPNLPASLETPDCRVRYQVRCVIDRAWKPEVVYKKAFSVMGKLDLNEEPEMKEPYKAVGEKSLCCLCCKSGPIQATLTANRHGFVPGESIVLEGEVDNQSNNKIKSAEIVLTQIITSYTRGDRNKWQKKEIDRLDVSGTEISPRSTLTWTKKTMTLPPLPPSGLKDNKIIGIKYILELVVRPAGPHRALLVPQPERNNWYHKKGNLTIGTIPLKDTSSRGIYVEPGVYMNPPPKYEIVKEADKIDMFAEENTEFTFGNQFYTPEYPMYHK